MEANGRRLVVPTLVLILSACAMPGAPPSSSTTAPSMTEPTASPTSAVEIPTIPGTPTGRELTGSPQTAEASDDAFRLTITADQDRYRAGQVIEVTATLTYLGPETSVVALGSGTGLVGFGVKSDDPEIVINAAFTSDCRTWPFVRDEVVEYPFSKSGGYGEDDPLAPFYRSYFEMPELRLPAGTWTIDAGADFFSGADCGQEGHQLHASVTVVIEP